MNGKIDYSQPVAGRGDTEFGSVATYTCNTGYDLTGESKRTCQATGTWSGKEPKCGKPPSMGVVLEDGL